MTEPSATLAVTQIGVVAARALTQGASGEVVATFGRSFYAAVAGNHICVGPERLGAGPLNIQFRGSAYPVVQGINVGAPVRVAAGKVVVGKSAALALAGATVWRPERAVRPGPKSPAGLTAFFAALPNDLPSEGLARLLTAGESDDLPRVAAAARRPAVQLAAVIRSGRESEGGSLHDLGSLIGLGPGLTPSGDDFLGGAMIACDSIDRADLRVGLWRVLGPLAATMTNDISTAHLAAAAEGYGSAALHAMIDAIICGDTAVIPNRLAALAAIGHTSGWDALAGAITVLEAAAFRR